MNRVGIAAKFPIRIFIPNQCPPFICGVDLTLRL